LSRTGGATAPLLPILVFLSFYQKPHLLVTSFPRREPAASRGGRLSAAVRTAPDPAGDADGSDRGRRRLVLAVGSRRGALGQAGRPATSPFAAPAALRCAGLEHPGFPPLSAYLASP
jgi:hypothetical protein